MENNGTNAPTTLEVICGGVALDLVHTDEQQTVEQIKVRQLPLGMMSRFGDAVFSEPAVAMLCTDKDEDWFNSLTTESQELLVNTALEINLSFFLRWADRQIDTGRKVTAAKARFLSGTSA